MNDTPSNSGLAGSNDIDPRFEDAAAGTAPPRPDADAALRSAQEQFAEAVAACSEWVRGKPMQAVALALGVGFLLGRSGR